jgi:hypothetical protein
MASAALAASMAMHASAAPRAVTTPDPLKDAPADSQVYTFSQMMFVGPQPMAQMALRGDCGLSAWPLTFVPNTVFAPVNNAFPGGVAPEQYDIDNFVMMNRNMNQSLANKNVIYESRCNTGDGGTNDKVHMVERCSADFSKACCSDYVPDIVVNTLSKKRATANYTVSASCIDADIRLDMRHICLIGCRSYYDDC